MTPISRAMVLLSIAMTVDANVVQEWINATLALESGGCNLIPSQALFGQLEPTDNPLLIDSKMHVLHIRNVPDGGGSFGVDVKIYLQWVDERYIEGNEHRATNCTSNHVVWQEVEPHFWLPKLDVEDAIKLEGFLEDQSKPATKGDRNLKYDVRNGVFNLFTKSYAEINCVMDFSLYPFDTQTCNFFVSAAKSKRYQEFRTSKPLFITNLDDTQTTTDRLQTEKFYVLLEPLISDEMFYMVANDTWSLTGFQIRLTRHSTPFLMNTYLPTALLTVASFISFLIPIDMVPGRMALLVTIFLMLVNIRSTERRMGPVTHFVTALDIWLLLCNMFVATATFEYAMLLLIRYGKRLKLDVGKMVKKRDAIVEKVDHYALRAFMGIYVLIDGIYFYIVYRNYML